MIFYLARTALIVAACFSLALAADEGRYERLKKDVATLAGTEMAGRGNGQEGLVRAIDYVVGKYKEIGIEPVIQNFPYRFTNSVNEGADGYFNNVIVTIKGNDDKLNGEHIVIGAHLDHLGTRTDLGGNQVVFFGADDNASGSAAVIELVRHFHNNPPARSLIFIHFTGEEWGMRGSKFWVANPTVELQSVCFMLNLDMIGRLGANKTMTLTAMGLEQEAIEKVKSLAPKDLIVVADRGTSIFAMASDHAPFFEKHIPSFFFFTGIHADYHRRTDTVDKINWNGLATITQYAQTLIAEYAGGTDLPIFQPD